MRVRAAWVRAGERLGTGDIENVGGVRVRVAHPPAPDWERPRVRNDDSLVLELRYGDVSVVLPGDVETGVEGAVAAALEPASWRVVKAPHHGSRTSSSAPFVEALRPVLAVLRPVLAVVSAGRYESAGAVVLATGEEGAIEICTDGRSLAVSSHDGRRLTFGPGA